MELRNFPLDSIRCELVFESYSYNAAEVTLDWLEWSPVTAVKEEFNLPDFKLINITHHKSTEVGSRIQGMNLYKKIKNDSKYTLKKLKHLKIFISLHIQSFSRPSESGALQRYTAGIWHRLFVNIHFDRLFGFYILQVSAGGQCGQCPARCTCPPTSACSSPGSRSGWTRALCRPASRCPCPA